MIYTAAAVKAACNALMTELLPALPVYGNTVLDGYKRPALFSELLVSPYERPGLYSHEYGYTYKVTLLETTHDEAYCYSIFETIRSGFGQKVAVGDGHLVVDTIEMDWIDERSDVLQVTVSFYPVSEISGRVEAGDMMTTVTIDYTTEVE